MIHDLRCLWCYLRCQRRAALEDVKAFQKRFKLTQDGAIGANTWNALIVNER